MGIVSLKPTYAQLVLSDGETFEGEAVGLITDVTSGEVVFNTVMCGYQEVISDPSYAGQIIAFTSTHIGNYGVHKEHNESVRPHCRGVVMRDLSHFPSGVRSQGNLDSFLRDYRVSAIHGIDTRRLTRHIRDAGSMTGAFGVADTDTLFEAAKREVGTQGVDLVGEVTTKHVYTLGSGDRNVIVYDLGVKTTILHQLAAFATVTVVPAFTPVADVMALKPDGVFLSNGPGDPTEVGVLAQEIAGIVGKVPLFGICLGHQILALALGGRTFKMRFGHHGGNVPVQDVRNGRIEITSQNHNFAVESGSVPGVTETHVCLNDNTLAGMHVDGADAFSVQYHPEASPGPHDSRRYFHEFMQMIDRYRETTVATCGTAEARTATCGAAAETTATSRRGV